MNKTNCKNRPYSMFQSGHSVGTVLVRGYIGF